MERFKQLTLNHTIVMGRKTYDSLPHGALPLRRNIVITQQEIQLENCEVYHSLTDALDKCTDDIIFIIGGESIYKQCLNLADNLYLTIVDKKMPKADTYFPSINSENWEFTPFLLLHSKITGNPHKIADFMMPLFNIPTSYQVAPPQS